VPRLEYGADTSASPERVIAAVKDFSERRPELWPNLTPDLYEVHQVTDSFAEVTEGSRFLGLEFWARERYEWPEPGVVRATTQDSNMFSAGNWELRATARDAGARVEIVNDRRVRGPRGHLVGVLMRLGRRTFATDLRRMLARVEQRGDAAGDASGTG
jgi:hypothetical protein